MNFYKFGVREFKKMNPELCEFFGNLVTGILKNESGTLRIFGNLGMGILENEFGTLRIFWKLGYRNFKK